MPVGKNKDLNRSRILIDFDRTVHKYSKGWHDGSIYDKPVPGAKEAVKKLVDRGYEVVIFTALSDRGDDRNKEIEKWLKRHGFPKLLVTNIKLSSRAIIDDRAIRFENNWRSILSYFI